MYYNVIEEFTFRNFLKDLGYRIGGAVLAVGLIFSLAYIGNKDILGLGRLLGGPGGLLVGTIVLMEAFFFIAIAVYYIRK